MRISENDYNELTKKLRITEAELTSERSNRTIDKMDYRNMQVNLNSDINKLNSDIHSLKKELEIITSRYKYATDEFKQRLTNNNLEYTILKDKYNTARHTIEKLEYEIAQNARKEFIVTVHTPDGVIKIKGYRVIENTTPNGNSLAVLDKEDSVVAKFNTVDKYFINK